MKKILPLLVILFYCSQPKETSNDVILNYNEKFLSLEKQSLGDSIPFQAPKGWGLAGPEVVNLIDSTIYQNAGSISKIFQDSTSESFLACLDNPPYQLSQDSIDLKNGKWLALQYSDFEYNDLFFQQTVLQNETVVLFKLNVKKSLNSYPISAVHFFIPRNMINSQSKLVESSIASINN